MNKLYTFLQVEWAGGFIPIWYATTTIYYNELLSEGLEILNSDGPKLKIIIRL